jgi:hypothetical protein
VESLRTLAIANGYDPDSLTPPNLVRAALGLQLRKRGGLRETEAAANETRQGEPMEIVYVCHECGEQLPEGAECCPQHPNATVDSIVAKK